MPFPFTLTARAENFIAGVPDLDDAIRRQLLRAVPGLAGGASRRDVVGIEDALSSARAAVRSAAAAIPPNGPRRVASCWPSMAPVTASSVIVTVIRPTSPAPGGGGLRPGPSRRRCYW